MAPKQELTSGFTLQTFKIRDQITLRDTYTPVIRTHLVASYNAGCNSDA
jgi:hypothetical protein